MDWRLLEKGIVSAKPFLSVVIPVFNREREIRRALESCLAQRGADFEVIVVDDASRDRSAQVVEEYAGSGVRLIRHPVNLGSSPARTNGMPAAEGDWIVRLDSDDELVPGALATAQRCALKVPSSVGRIGLMYRYTDGRIPSRRLAETSSLTKDSSNGWNTPKRTTV